MIHEYSEVGKAKEVGSALPKRPRCCLELQFYDRVSGLGVREESGSTLDDSPTVPVLLKKCVAQNPETCSVRLQYSGKRRVEVHENRSCR